MKKKELKCVLLIVMPFFSIKAPALGVSLLKARLKEEGIPCAIRYLNFSFAERIGIDLYEQVCAHKSDSGDNFNGEWLFAQEYFGSRLPNVQEYAKLMSEAGVAREDLNKVLSLTKHVGPFLDSSLETLKLSEYDIIGFSTVFDQNLASIALAERIKRCDPEKIIVFGGANCDGDMGLELHRHFPCIDFVCTGEAEFSFPALVKKIFDGKSPRAIPGIIRRVKNVSVMDVSSSINEDLDSLPFADFDDYFSQLGTRAMVPLIRQSGLPMETSRGCWWGSKAKCTFCGLTTDSLPFRSKNPDRVLREIEHVQNTYLQKHHRNRISMTDNILDMNFFDNLIPALAEKKLPVSFFYETKANLSQEQIHALAAAGVNFIQPGIESLSSSVLRMISKGTTALQNIQLLKNCSQYLVYPVWNLLYGFPGEKPENYRLIIDIISKITHLPPPDGFARFELQRFSPYFTRPHDFGIDNIRPKASYSFIYPFEKESLCKLAYHFDFDLYHDQCFRSDVLHLKRAVEHWQQSYAAGAALELWSASPLLLLVRDTRPQAKTTWIKLTSYRRTIYDFCGQIRSISEILAHARQKYATQPLRERDIREILQELINDNIMACEADKYLSLAVPVDNTLSG